MRRKCKQNTTVVHHCRIEAQGKAVAVTMKKLEARSEREQFTTLWQIERPISKMTLRFQVWVLGRSALICRNEEINLVRR